MKMISQYPHNAVHKVELKEALFQMDHKKALGSDDDFPAAFYQVF